jgi:hypothetical protein
VSVGPQNDRLGMLYQLWFFCGSLSRLALRHYSSEYGHDIAEENCSVNGTRKLTHFTGSLARLERSRQPVSAACVDNTLQAYLSRHRTINIFPFYTSASSMSLSVCSTLLRKFCQVVSDGSCIQLEYLPLF